MNFNKTPECPNYLNYFYNDPPPKPRKVKCPAEESEEKVVKKKCTDTVQRCKSQSKRKEPKPQKFNLFEPRPQVPTYDRLCSTSSETQFQQRRVHYLDQATTCQRVAGDCDHEKSSSTTPVQQPKQGVEKSCCTVEWPSQPVEKSCCTSEPPRKVEKYCYTQNQSGEIGSPTKQKSCSVSSKRVTVESPQQYDSTEEIFCSNVSSRGSTDSEAQPCQMNSQGDQHLQHVECGAQRPIFQTCHGQERVLIGPVKLMRVREGGHRNLFKERVGDWARVTLNNPTDYQRIRLIPKHNLKSLIKNINCCKCPRQPIQVFNFKSVERDC
ncbi:uncharacterized protein LOC109596318 [Aethina tumida]|uniref:uncharacterized protein LOC109596318 n=1 Tax=Aethina tumida TaxID=116153 RepID=UPI00096B6262|nr:uncharacterized protein LOC109596318 [Aethina tumida]